MSAATVSEGLLRYIADGGSIIHRCDNCGVLGKTVRRCHGCFSTFFCNQTCQKASWPKHRLFCKNVQPLLAELKTCYFQIKAEDPQSQQFITTMKKLTPIYRQIEKLHKDENLHCSFSSTINSSMGEKKADSRIIQLISNHEK